MTAAWARMGKRVGRLLLLMLLVALGTLALVRFAPGYFADVRELDAQSADTVRGELEARRTTDGSASAMATMLLRGFLHGNLGISRQYGVPVAELVRPRLRVTGLILGKSLALGWLLAVAAALPLSARRSAAAETSVAIGSAFLLAVPVGALATFFLLTDTGGPVLAIALLLAARDFKFLYRLLHRHWQSPHLLVARAQGVRPTRLVLAHLLPACLPQLTPLVNMSVVAALSLAVPAEVLFDVPGMGQLAWTAAMNRDLPLLLAVTLLMAAAVGCAGLCSEPASAAALSPEMA